MRDKNRPGVMPGLFSGIVLSRMIGLNDYAVGSEPKTLTSQRTKATPKSANTPHSIYGALSLTAFLTIL